MTYSWGDLVSLEYGKPVKDKAKTDGKYPVYGTNGQIGTSDLPALCDHPSFILGRKGAYRGVHFSDTPFSVIDTAFYAENLHPELLDLKWAYYKFLTYDINSMDSGSAIPSTDRYEIYAIEVDLPSIHEQKRIVKLLECLDMKTAVNRKINDNLQQQAFAIFDRLLSNNHLSECCLSQIAIINPKRILKKNEFARCIDMAQLSTSGSFPTGWEVKPFSGGMRFSNGDTLLARITPCLENGKTAYIDFLNENEVAFGSTEYVVIASQGEYPPEFFYCLARYPAFVDYAVKNMNGSSGRQRVSAETVGNYVLPVLTDDELSEFRSTVPSLFKVIKNNSTENMSLAQLRDALLPKLMSGEIDVRSVNN